MTATNETQKLSAASLPMVLSAQVRPLQFQDVKASAEIARITGLTGSWPNFTRPHMREFPDDMRRGYIRSQLLGHYDDSQLVEVIELKSQALEKPIVAGFSHWHLPSVAANGSELPTKKDLKKKFARIAVKAWLPSTDRTVDPHRDELLDEAAFAVIKEYKVAEQYMELYHLAIHPDFQRRGYGRLLLESGLKVAQEKKLPVAILAVPEAVGMYEASGFKIILRKDVIDANEGGKVEKQKAEVVLMMMDEGKQNVIT